MTEEWMRKMWYHLYNGVLQSNNNNSNNNNNILRFAGKWVEIENIILSEVTQTQKDKHMYLLICLQRQADLCEFENSLVYKS